MKMESSPFLGVEMIQFLPLLIEYITNKIIVKYYHDQETKHLGGQINERHRDTG